MEQVLDWLNENELRAFPLLDDADPRLNSAQNSVWRVPNGFLLDLQLLVILEDLEEPYTLQSGEVVQKSSSVYLKKIARTELDEVLIVFGTELNDLGSFTLSAPTEVSYPFYLRTAQGLVVLGESVKDFLQLATTATEYTGLVPVEPSTCTVFNRAWLGVNSIHTNPEKQSVLNSHEPVLPLIEISQQSASSLIGDIKFLEGYNFRVNISKNLIDLEIGTSFGLKMDCSTSFLDPKYLDCEDIVSYINGVPPDSLGNFSLNAGSNISITKGNSLNTFSDSYSENSNDNTIFVGLSFQSSDICNPVNISPSLL
jgi:hypothetical protein